MMQALWDEERYQLEQPLSVSGAFNPHTFLVRDAQDKKKKVIRRIDEGRFDPQRIDILNKLKSLVANSNILSLFDYSTSSDGQSLVLIMTYCIGENLKTMIQRTTAPLASDRVVDLTYQILKGLAFLHSHDIIHINLQPKNLFQSWVYGHIRIGMIGVMRLDQLSNDEWSYLSPQLLQNQPYTKKTDIWSLACIVYELLTLQKAYPGMSMFHMINQVLNRPLDLNRIRSELLRAILDKCFQIEESTRHDATQVQEALLSYQQSLADLSAHLKPGFALNNGRYIIRRVLNEGDFGQVYLADDQTDQTEKVIKQISTLDSSLAQREIDIMKNLTSHPNVVAFCDHFLHFSHILVIEYCKAGKLSEVIANKKMANEQIPDQVIFNWSIQILRGLEFFHSNGIVHLDVKPANVFFDQHGNLKLGHHCLARDINSMKSVLGLVESYNYMSAEYMQRRPFTKSTDVWSFGCLFFELCSLQKPFIGVSPLGVFQDHSRLNPIYSQLRLTYISIVKKCLQNEPDARPTTTQVLDWINKMVLMTCDECIVLEQFTKKQFDKAANQLAKQTYIIDVYLDVIMSFDPVLGLRYNSSQVAQCLNWIGQEYDFKREYTSAFDYKQRACSMYTVLGMERSEDMAECLVEISKTCHLRGEHVLELDYLNRAHSIYSSEDISDSDQKAECLMLLGRAHNWHGDHESEFNFKLNSFKMYQRLLLRYISYSQAETVRFRAYSNGFAICILELGLAYRFKGAHDLELENIRTAYGMFKNMRGPNDVEVGKVAKQLGISCHLNRQFTEALNYKQKSVHILEEVYGLEGDVELALSYLELGVSQVLRGCSDEGMKNTAFGMLKGLRITNLDYYARYYLSMSRIFHRVDQVEAQLQYNLIALSLYEMAVVSMDDNNVNCSPGKVPYLEGLAAAYDNIAYKTACRAEAIRNRFLYR